MAPRTKTKAKRPTIPEDSLGKPDIYALCEEHDITPGEAAEMAGIAESTAYQLYWRQEVEHNPDLKVKPNIRKDRGKLGNYVVKMRDEGEDGVKLRWEKLVHRTGLSKTELIELYEEITGEPSKRLRGGKAEEDEAPVPTKSKRNGGRKSKAVEVAEEEDADEAEAEEAPRPKRRAKARR